jgi:hypothetical protein
VHRRRVPRPGGQRRCTGCTSPSPSMVRVHVHIADAVKDHVNVDVNVNVRPLYSAGAGGSPSRAIAQPRYAMVPSRSSVTLAGSE